MKGALADSILLLEQFGLFCFGAVIVWAWPDAPILVLAGGYITGLAGLTLLGGFWAVQALKVLRWVRSEWRRTFRRR